MKTTFVDKEFIVEKVGEYREFDRTDGSTGSVQRIDNLDDEPSITVWDRSPLTLQAGDKYGATNLILKDKEYKGKEYQEYSTCKNSKISPLNTRMDKETYYEDKIAGEARNYSDKVRNIPTDDYSPELLEEILSRIKILDEKLTCLANDLLIIKDMI